MCAREYGEAKGAKEIGLLATTRRISYSSALAAWFHHAPILNTHDTGQK
jgi:hypothetical protein